MPSVTDHYGLLCPRLNFETFQNLDADPADTIRTVTDSADAIRTITDSADAIRTITE
jgi:hypothetical protein